MAKTKTYKFRWREGGVHKQKSFPSRAHRDLFIAKLKGGNAPTGPRPSSVTFRAFARDTWIPEHARVEKSETQWRQDETILALHLEPAFGNVALKDLKPEHLLELRRRLTTEKLGRYKRQLKTRSINHILTLAKQITATAVRRQQLGVDPFAGVKLLTLHEQPFDYWTAEERDQFLRFCRQVDPDFARLALVACHTGLRKGELWALQRGQLDFANRQIMVSATYDHKLKKRLERTKDGGWGVVPMNDAVYEALKGEALRAGTAQIFPDDLIGDACHRLARNCLRTGSRVIRFHDLRHTFASCLAMAGVPIYEIQRLMRHKSLQMTQRYAHLAPGHLKSAVDRLCAPESESCARFVRDARTGG